MSQNLKLTVCQKAVMISHRNVISNVLSFTTYESYNMKMKGMTTQITLGLLPLSHIYGLVAVAHCSTYRGDAVIILPRFEFNSYLNAIERFRIERLLVVCETWSELQYLWRTHCHPQGKLTVKTNTDIDHRFHQS